MTTRQTISQQDTDLIRNVRAAQRGDRQAFGELVKRYERAVYIIVYRRLRNDAEAQELCQDVFIQAMRKIDQLREPRAFGSWIRSIASRMAINRAIRRAPVVTGSDTVWATSIEYETPLESVLSREREDQVHVGLDRLRPLDRETLVSFYFDGNSLVEMSEQFHSPVGTIKRRLHVARKRLAEELQDLAPAAV